MEEDLLIIKLLHIIKNERIDSSKKKYGVSIFLFGSILYKNNPNDIDILMLYPINTKCIDEIFRLKDSLKEILKKKLLMDIDILVLSYDEEKEINFIDNERAIEIT